VFTFSCPLRQQEQWQPTAQKVMNSVKLKWCECVQVLRCSGQSIMNIWTPRDVAGSLWPTRRSHKHLNTTPRTSPQSRDIFPVPGNLCGEGDRASQWAVEFGVGQDGR
jgi:hypothetical protein